MPLKTTFKLLLLLPICFSVSASEAWILTPNQKFRIWTPRFRNETAWKQADALHQTNLLGEGVRGFVRGAPFAGQLIRLQGLQNSRSHCHAVIMLKNGTIRAWPMLSFTDSDLRYLKNVYDKFLKPDKNRESFKRIVNYQNYKKENYGKTYEIFETDYWTVWRGLSKEDEGATAFTPDFMPRVLKYLDQTWCFYRDVLGFPMPWSDKEHQANDWKNDPVHHKVNVFLTHTGLAHHKSGWANGARGIQIHPNAFGDGSSVLPHEAGHVMQLYSGGMRNLSTVGSFWETHANWQAHQFIPSFVGNQKKYFDNMHFSLNWSGHRYSSWMWLQHIYEAPNIDSQLPIDVWLENRKDDKGRSTEDPIQTFLRLFVEKKIFPGDPMEGFGDELGIMAARMITMDYVYQQTYLDARVRAYNKQLPAAPVITVEEIPGRIGTLRPTEEYIPDQYGVNIIQIKNPSSRIKVSLEKDTLRECSSGSWRLTLVAVARDLKTRYSAMTRGKAVSIEVNDGDQVFAAVTAVPSVHRPREFNDVEGLSQKFPYVLVLEQDFDISSTKKLRPKTSTNKFKKPTPSNSTQSHGSRIWTDITGNFTREASFIELAEGKVTLQLTDGRRTIISFEILSKKDQEYVLDIGDSQ